MGQAKLRGTFEQRKAEGIARRERKFAEREKARRIRMQNLRQRSPRLSATLGMVVALTAGKE